MGGKACIRGLRVTVGMLVGQIGAGHTVEEVLVDFPYLERGLPRPGSSAGARERGSRGWCRGPKGANPRAPARAGAEARLPPGGQARADLSMDQSAKNRKRFISHREEIPRQVEEDRRREGEAVHAVEHAAVPLDHRAPVLGPERALDRREDEAAGEAGERPPPSAIASASAGEKGVSHQSAPPSSVAAAPPPRKPSQVLFGLTRGAIFRRPSVLPKTYCRTSLPCTTRSRKARSPKLPAGAPGTSRMQQRRRVARAVDREHQRPLHLGDPRQEVLRLARQHGDERQQQEAVDRDRDREEPVPVVPEQHVLQRQEQVEGGGERIMVRRRRRRQRGELAQAPEGDEREEEDRRQRPGEEGEAEDGDDRPPAGDPLVEVRERRRPLGSARPRARRGAGPRPWRPPAARRARRRA